MAKRSLNEAALRKGYAFPHSHSIVNTSLTEEILTGLPVWHGVSASTTGHGGERAIFCKILYLNEAGLRMKFHFDNYVRRIERVGKK